MRYRLSYKRRVSAPWQELPPFDSYVEARRQKATYRARRYLVALHWWHEAEQRWIGT